MTFNKPFYNLGNLQITFNELFKEKKKPFFVVFDIETSEQLGYNTKNGSCKNMNIDQFYNHVRNSTCKSLNFGIRYFENNKSQLILGRQ